MDNQLPNPFRQQTEGPKRKPMPGVSQREWTRLYAMAVVFMICVGGAIYAKKSMDALKKKEEALPAGQVEYSIEGMGKKPEAPQAAPDKPAPQDPAKPKVEIPIPPLPKDGAVNLKELAAPFRDGREKPVKETPEFIQMMNVVLNAVTPEDMAKRVSPGLSTEAVYREPQKHRGDVLRVYGRLIYIYTERMETTTPNNIEYVYLAVMQEYPKNRTVYFYLPEKPKDPATGKPLEFKTHVWKGQTIYDDWVEIEGVFLRTFDYAGQKATEDQQGDTLVKSLMLMVKNLRIVEKPKMKNTREGFITVISVGAAIVVAIVLVAGIMSKRYGNSSIRMKIFAVRRDKAKLEGKDVFGRKPPEAPAPEAPKAEGGTAPPAPPPEAPKA